MWEYGKQIFIWDDDYNLIRHSHACSMIFVLWFPHSHILSLHNQLEKYNKGERFYSNSMIWMIYIVVLSYFLDIFHTNVHVYSFVYENNRSNTSSLEQFRVAFHGPNTITISWRTNGTWNDSNDTPTPKVHYGMKLAVLVEHLYDIWRRNTIKRKSISFIWCCSNKTFSLVA